MNVPHSLEVATCSDIGGRGEQQDRVAAFESVGARLLVLADGMGGHEGGALAAHAVVEVARELFQWPLTEAPQKLLALICGGAHRRINAIGTRLGIAPHSTCVLLHLGMDTATWAHVGDSRLYRFHAGRCVGRTIDHSVVELMRLQDRITESEMKTHPDQNRLYKAVGGAEPPEVEMESGTLSPDDGFVLASDGLWEHVEDHELEELLEAPDLEAGLSGLVAVARCRGGKSCDNISAAAVRSRPVRATAARQMRRVVRRPGRHVLGRTGVGGHGSRDGGDSRREVSDGLRLGR